MFRNLGKRLWRAATVAELGSRGYLDFSSRSRGQKSHAYLSSRGCNPVREGLYAGRRSPPGKRNKTEWAWPRLPPTPAATVISSQYATSESPHCNSNSKPGRRPPSRSRTAVGPEGLFSHFSWTAVVGQGPIRKSD